MISSFAVLNNSYIVIRITQNSQIRIDLIKKSWFSQLVNKTISPDEVLIGDVSSTTDGLRINKDNDFTPVAKANRDKLFKKYQPLIHKIVNQFVGKTNVSAEDLYSSACEGFVYAMNTFGHPKKRDEDGKWVEVDKNEQHINYTFGQYAAYAIRNTILGAIENSHLVRIPKSEQKRQRDELGFNIKTNTISGNKTVGHDSDGNGKELFDYIDNAENGGKSIDNEDLQKLWKEAFWSQSFCLLTAGGAPVEVIRQYIETQGEKKH